MDEKTVVDVDRLTEAVERMESFVWAGCKDRPGSALRHITAAARAVVEAPTVDWCWKHSDVAKWGHETYPGLVCDNAWDKDEPDCEVGRVRLVAESQL